MCPHFMMNSLDNDLYVAGWRYKLDEVTGCIQIWGQRVTERSTPKPSLRQEIIGLTINDDVSQPASVHRFPVLMANVRAKAAVR
jgi:hypothetical protein